MIRLFCTALFTMLSLVAQAMPTHTPVPGGVAIVGIGESSGAAVPPVVRFRGQRALVVRNDHGWFAVVGVPLDAKPGPATLEIEGTDGPRAQGFMVTVKHYPVQKLTIPDQRKVEPSVQDMKRISREQEVINRVRTNWVPNETVDLAIALPADGPLSSRFGLRRVFNGQPRNPHNGLDLAVPRGTPIRTAAAGVVTHIGDLFFAGKTVFVDHGQGLVTMYCHLDDIAVQNGDRLVRGQRIGQSGMTGRVTGPHLHWSIYLNGTAVDPELFLR